MFVYVCEINARIYLCVCVGGRGRKRERAFVQICVDVHGCASSMFLCTQIMCARNKRPLHCSSNLLLLAKRSERWNRLKRALYIFLSTQIPVDSQNSLTQRRQQAVAPVCGVRCIFQVEPCRFLKVPWKFSWQNSITTRGSVRVCACACVCVCVCVSNTTGPCRFSVCEVMCGIRFKQCSQILKSAVKNLLRAL